MIASQKRFLASTCLLLGMCAHAFSAPNITLNALEWPPYSWTDPASGRIIGIHVDIIRELMTRAQIQVSKWESVPWARGLLRTTLTANSCQLTVGRIAEREARYQWIGPIGEAEWVLFARSSDNIVLHSIQDARPYLVGTIIDDLSIPILRAQTIRIDAVASDKLNAPKLLRKRIDLWASAYLPAMYILRDLRITGLEPVLSLSKIDLYLACNKRMSDDEARRLNDILKHMFSDKSIDRIYIRNGFAKR